MLQHVKHELPLEVVFECKELFLNSLEKSHRNADFKEGTRVTLECLDEFFLIYIRCQ